MTPAFSDNNPRTLTLALAAMLVTTFTVSPVLAEEAPPVNSGNVSISAGADFTTAYFFRGINQEDTGFIFQPYAEIAFAVPCDIDGISNASLAFGIWNSFHDKHTGASGVGSEPSSWYESDLYVTLAFDLPDNWSTSLTYTAYTSPNDAFATVHELAVGLGFNDADCWTNDEAKERGFEGLQPSLTVAFELENTAFGPDEGTFLALGIEPGFNLTSGDGNGDPIRVTIPVTLGFSLSDYYDDGTDQDDFGFADIGVAVAIPLGDVPAAYGSWTLTAAVHVLIFADNLEAANNGDDTDVLASLGVSMGY